MVILLTKDYDDTRSLIRVLLQVKGHQVVEAVNGAEAVEFAMHERPDLIPMDLNTPVMDSIEATRTVKAWPEVSDGMCCKKYLGASEVIRRS